jgi:hypothetical protein
MLFLIHGLKLLTASRLASAISESIALVADALARGARGYALGLMLGMLARGFLYGAIVASA